MCDRVVDEIRRQGEADQTLIAGACQNGELVERVGIALDRGELDLRRTSFSEIVRGMDREASRHGYMLLLANVHAGNDQSANAACCNANNSVMPFCANASMAFSSSGWNGAPSAVP